MGVGSMSSLYIGVSGLQSNQSALNTTAHNLSNVDTTGFVRQQVLLKDTLYHNIGRNGVSTMQVGVGTAVQTVRQAREEFLDKAYRLESGRSSFYSTQYDVVSEIERYFGELEGEEFNGVLTDFYNALNEVQKDPSNLVTRSTMIEVATDLVNRSGLIYKQLQDYQVNLNQQLIDQVQQINDMAEEINKLNQSVSKVETGGVEHANDLRDARNELLDKLSQYGEIKYTENAQGVVSILFEGKPLVTEDEAFKLGTEKISQDSDLLKVVWASHANIDAINLSPIPSANEGTDVGSLKGILLARGERTGSYLDLQSPTYSEDTNPFTVTNTEALFDNLIHNITTTINDILCPNTKTTADITATDGTVIAAGTEVLDVANAPVGLGEDGKPGTELFSRDGVDRYKEYQYVDGTGKTQTVYVYQKEDPTDGYSLYNIDHLVVNPDVVESPGMLTLSNPNKEIAQKVANDLLKAWQGSKDFPSSLVTLSPNTLTKLNFSQYYIALIGDVANRGNSFKTVADSQENVVNQIDNSRQVVAGVSSDEELSNMMMYQHAYNASSRFFNVVNDMLETLVNLI